MPGRIYLDYNATSPVLPEVLEAMMPYFSEKFGNPSSQYSYGQEARAALESARESCAALIGADPAEIVFTSGGSESNNTALNAALRRDGSRRRIVTSSIEHSSILSPCRKMSEEGVEVVFLPVSQEGIVESSSLESELDEKVAILSIMLANNETGAIQPLEEFRNIASRSGTTVHTDAVQAAGKMEIDVRKLGVDMLSFAAHKIYGPKGVGALFVRKGFRPESFIYGGGQEKGLRAGTENLPGIVGFGKACDLARKDLSARIDHYSRLRKALLAALSARIGDMRLNTPLEKSLVNTLNAGFAGVPADALVVRLDLGGVCVSGGSACAGLNRTSHVLKAMNVPVEYLFGSIRISLGIMTTEKDVSDAACAISEAVAYIRKSALPG